MGWGGGEDKDAGVAGSSVENFTFLSLAQKRNIGKLLLLLSLANHSPLKTSLCRFPELLVCGFYRCNLVSGSQFNFSVSCTCPASSHKGGQLGSLVKLCLCPSEAVVWIWEATPGLQLGWRNRSAALQVSPHSSHHDRGTSKGLRK